MELTPEQQLRNVIASVRRHTEVMRTNGRGRPYTYASGVDAIANSAQHLADLVEQYLDGDLAVEVVEDDLPF